MPATDSYQAKVEENARLSTEARPGVILTKMPSVQIGTEDGHIKHVRTAQSFQ